MGSNDIVTAETVYNAGADLRNRKITPDQYRDIMRKGREQHGEREWEMVKVRALHAMDRTA